MGRQRKEYRYSMETKEQTGLLKSRSSSSFAFWIVPVAAAIVIGGAILLGNQAGSEPSFPTDVPSNVFSARDIGGEHVVHARDPVAERPVPTAGSVPTAELSREHACGMVDVILRDWNNPERAELLLALTEAEDSTGAAASKVVAKFPRSSIIDQGDGTGLIEVVGALLDGTPITGTAVVPTK